MLFDSSDFAYCCSLFRDRQNRIHLLKSITCTCSQNDVHERNDTHDMHDSTQILSFVSAYCFFCGNRSATMSSKKKEKGAERLRKSVERKKEVSRET